MDNVVVMPWHKSQKEADEDFQKRGGIIRRFMTEEELARIFSTTTSAEG